MPKAFIHKKELELILGRIINHLLDQQDNEDIEQILDDLGFDTNTNIYLCKEAYTRMREEIKNWFGWDAYIKDKEERRALRDSKEH